MQLTRSPARLATVIPAGLRAAGDLVVTGAHGGAGTSTLATLLHPAGDMGVIYRPGHGCPQARIGRRPLVLVTMNSASGSARASAAVTALSAQGVRAAVLAVVSDGLPDSAAARYRLRLLEPQVGAMVRVPFVPSLRAVDDPTAVDLPRGALQALARIRAEAFRAATLAHSRTR